MAIYINDSLTEENIRKLAKVTGETMKDAVRIAVQEKLQDLFQERQNAKNNFTPLNKAQALHDLIAEYQAAPIYDVRSPEEIIGYNKDGLWD